MTSTAGPGDLEIKRIGAITIISRDSIVLKSWSNENRIRKLELAGYRTTEGRGWTYFKLFYKDSSLPPDQFLVPQNKRASVCTALSPLPDLDLLDQQNALKAIAENDLWGLRPDERMATLAAEKRWVLAVNIAAVAIAAWALIYPHPRIYAVGACAAATALVLAATVFKQGRWRVNLNKNDPRPSVAIALIACTIGIAARALFDVDTFDWQPWVGAAAVLGVIGAVAMPMLFPELKSRGAVITVAIFAFAFGLGFIGSANTILDASPAQIYKAEITDKYVSHGRSTSYTWVLGPWGASRGGSESVDSDLYDQLNVGDVACVYFHSGALHMRWYTVSSCSWTKPE